MFKYFFRFENHEECDNGGDDSETSNESNNDEDPCSIFVISCVFVDPKMLTIKYGEGEAPVPVNIAGEPLRVLQVLVPAA